MKTMICLILDRSGSMGGRENDVINGVNTFIADQKKLPDPASIAFVRFDSEAIERFRSMASLAECQPLNRDEYSPRGGTPLLDAIGKTLEELDNDWFAEKPDRAVLVIVTDGENNASHKFTKAQIKRMIESRQESGKWAIIYLGADVDAFVEASSMGISTQNTANYKATPMGMRSMYAAASASVESVRKTGFTLSSNLGGDIEEDGQVTRRAPSVQQQAQEPLKTEPWTAPEGNRPWSPPA